MDNLKIGVFSPCQVNWFPLKCKYVISMIVEKATSVCCKQFLQCKIGNAVKLSNVIDELVEEKGLDRETLRSVICEGVLAAFQKKHPEAQLTTEYDKKSDDIFIKIQKKVVASVENDDQEISLRKAKFIDKNVVLGDAMWLPFERSIGRV